VFKFEPHTHTAESSACSILPARELVEGYHAAGFNGIAITDHLYKYLVTSHKNQWGLCIDYLLRGYKEAKKWGDELGIAVILGMEIRFTDCPNDYLVYGFDENFLRETPNLCSLGLKKFFRRFRKELLIIHAHPYRYGNEAVYTEYIHGIEVYNGNPRHSNYNKKARALYAAQPKLCPINASDVHEPEDIGGGWIEFYKPVGDSFQFRDAVLGREYKRGQK